MSENFLAALSGRADVVLEVDGQRGLAIGGASLGAVTHRCRRIQETTEAGVRLLTDLAPYRADGAAATDDPTQ